MKNKFFSLINSMYSIFKDEGLTISENFFNVTITHFDKRLKLFCFNQADDLLVMIANESDAEKVFSKMNFPSQRDLYNFEKRFLKIVKFFLEDMSINCQCVIKTYSIEVKIYSYQNLENFNKVNFFMAIRDMDSILLGHPF